MSLEARLQICSLLILNSRRVVALQTWLVYYSKMTPVAIIFQLGLQSPRPQPQMSPKRQRVLPIVVAHLFSRGLLTYFSKMMASSMNQFETDSNFLFKDQQQL